MSLGHLEVVGLDRDSVENRRDEALPLVTPTPLRQLNANPQLRHGNSRYSDIITVVNGIA